MEIEVKEKKRKPTYEDLVELLPKKCSLFYVDYRDSLDEHTDGLNSWLKTGYNDELSNEMDEGFSEQEWSSSQELIKTLKEDAINAGFKKKTVKALIEANRDEFRNTLYERDDSNIMKDLLSNTGSLVAVYSLGVDIEETWNSSAQFRLSRIIIKKALQITDSKYDKQIEELIANASYGGELSIFFNVDMDDFNMPEGESDFNMIKFSNPSVGLPHYGNGSGHDVFLKGHSFKVPFLRDNVFLDKSMKYNYTYAVCGMPSDWCSNTDVELSIEDVPDNLCEVKVSGSSAIREADEKYNLIYKSGKCSFGDMDMNRHRGVIYINDYPCGNKCPNCGTFWID